MTFLGTLGVLTVPDRQPSSCWVRPNTEDPRMVMVLPFSVQKKVSVEQKEVGDINKSLNLGGDYYRCLFSYNAIAFWVAVWSRGQSPDWRSRSDFLLLKSFFIFKAIFLFFSFFLFFVLVGVGAIAGSRTVGPVNLHRWLRKRWKVGGGGRWERESERECNTLS